MPKRLEAAVSKRPRSYRSDQRTHAHIPHDGNATKNVPSIERVVESGHRIATSIRDLLHLGQLVRAAGGQVQERELVEVLRALERLLHDLSEMKQGNE